MRRTIEYEIKLNDQGRPYIEIYNYKESVDENNFFAIEMTTNLLNGYIDRIEKKNVSIDYINESKSTYNFLIDFSNMSASIIKSQMIVMGELERQFNNEYHIVVENFEELLALDMFEIIYENKIFKRTEGLKALQKDINTIYELKDGIENDDWKYCGKLIKDENDR